MIVKRLRGLSPLTAADARVLLLGSMPSVASLRSRQYYAHPRNAFWWLLGELVGAGRELPYEQRLRVLGDAGVALWDVAHRCQRTGSADATLRDVEPNDIASLLDRCPRIGAVFCNGRKAQALFSSLILPELVSRRRELHLRYLPSTSPAHAGMTLRAKLAAWREILDWL